jgi:hypothetical protein
MPKIEIEVLYTREVRQEGSKVLELNIPQSVINEGGDAVAAWLEDRIQNNKIDAYKDIYVDSDINDEDENITVDEVCILTD